MMTTAISPPNRDLESIIAAASVAQRAAADPETSAWVAASAGTGKTRVLTNRFLRLLLLGEPPESLLALTFTKAAAAEMANRITDELEVWAQSDDERLHAELTKLVARPPTTAEMRRARLLFTQSLALPQGFSIQTIHSFCGSLLKRFPIEAGLSPDSQQLDEHGANSLLGDVIAQIALELPPKAPARQAMDRILIRLTPEALVELMQHANGERARIAIALDTFGGAKGTLQEIARTLGLDPSILDAASPEDAIFETFWTPTPERKDALTTLEAAIAGSSTKFAVGLSTALKSMLFGRDREFDDYAAAFLTTKGEPRKPTIKEIKNNPDMLARFEAEADQVALVREALAALGLVQLNQDFLVLSQEVLTRVERLKRAQNAIDFDDMILLTARLLEGGPGTAQWVQYKLDQGVRHLLVDEAQDTNPDQWRVIKALAAEFFSGQGTEAFSGLERSLFVVGDLKQSIYGFQRADPALFAQGRAQFQASAATANKPWLDQPLTTTFRCAPAILDAVNAVFTQPGMAEGLIFADDDGWTHHSSARVQARGEVLLIPPLIKPKRQAHRGWAAMPGEQETQEALADDGFDAIETLAHEVARQIAHWTSANTNATNSHDDQSQWLSASHGGLRRVQPGDVLILLKKRGPFADQLIASLQALNVPVAGADRLHLMDQLVIKDLLVLADASLQPADDLAVATILRSPLIGMDDATLERLALKRLDDGLTLFEALNTSLLEPDRQAATFLAHCQALANSLPPYEFFARVLYANLIYPTTGASRFLGRLGRQVLDPLHELLAQARRFESEAPATLQKFLVWIRSRNESIKRDLEADDDHDEAAEDQGSPLTGLGQVRIMTAHASKGLEAPIVILADAYQKGTQRFSSKLIWEHPKSSDTALPIWSPSSDDDSEQSSVIKERIKRNQALEDRRLLYVAMTRAEERLVVFGMREDSDTAEQQGWYPMIRDGLAALDPGQEQIVGALPNGSQWQGTAYRWSTADPQDNAPSAPATTTTQTTPTTAPAAEDTPAPTLPSAFGSALHPSLPRWALTPPPAEPAPPRPLSPSHLDPQAEATLAAPSPLDQGASKRFLRGNLIHALFRMLPDLPPDQWPAVGQRLLNKPNYGFTPQGVDHMLAQVFDIVQNPAYSALFGPNSRAEVPLSGLVAKVPIAGQVDRLVEVANDAGVVQEVLVIDYKTNRPPPTTADKIPKAYRLQMAAYGRILQQIYPTAHIRPFLLWTETAHLMEVHDWANVPIDGESIAQAEQLTLL